MKPRLLRFSYFPWAVVPAALFGIHQLYGLPHAIWSYEFRSYEFTGASSGDFATRHYTRCTFVGPYGAFTMPATDGRCGWIVFRKASEAFR